MKSAQEVLQRDIDGVGESRYPNPEEWQVTPVQDISKEQMEKELAEVLRVYSRSMNELQRIGKESNIEVFMETSVSILRLKELAEKAIKDKYRNK